MGILKEALKDSYQIYCDLDGTIGDFNKRFEHYTGIEPEEYKKISVQQFGEEKGLEQFWNLIDNKIGVRFYRGMPWMPEGRELWEYIKPLNPIILTAPSRNEVSRVGKMLWVKDNLGDDIPVQFKAAKYKHEFAGPGKILIDDRLDTILRWKAAEGIGLLYEGNTKKIITELKKMGL